jgi:hypothetical protein
MGKGLVADLYVSGYVNQGLYNGWLVDVQTVDAGKKEYNGPAAVPTGCKFRDGSINRTSGYSGRIALGDPWSAAYVHLPPGTVGVGALGDVGHGGKWGGINLPYDLTPLGAPGCFWLTSVLNVAPLRESKRFIRALEWPDLQIPRDPALAGAVFFDQAVFADPQANALGAVVSVSSKWTIGTGDLTAVRVYAIQAANKWVGIGLEECVVSQFTY